MAVYSAVLQLVAAVSSLTFVLVTGVKGLLGLGPAIFLTASALVGAARREGDGGADRRRAGARPAGAGRAAGRDPGPSRRAPGDARRAGELRRDGLGDEPHRLRRR